MEEISYMLEKIVDWVDEWRNRCANEYFNILHKNGIEDEDVVFDLFDELMDGYDDVEEAVSTLQELKECQSKN